MTRIKSFDPLKKETVEAGVFENGTFYKKVFACHYMKAEHGYGISEDVIQKLIELGCKRIIIDANTNFYEVAFEDWMRQPVKDYGSGLQRFFSVKRNHKPAKGHMSLL